MIYVQYIINDMNNCQDFFPWPLCALTFLIR